MRRTLNEPLQNLNMAQAEYEQVYRAMSQWYF